MNWTSADIEALKGRKPQAAKPAPSTPLQRMQALGRLPNQGMNKTETAYAQHLERRKQAGEVLWFEFEPMNLRLAEKCFYRVDFMVLLLDGSLEAHEVKGYWNDEARVKTKVAAAKFPFQFYGVQRDGKTGWKFEKF